MELLGMAAPMLGDKAYERTALVETLVFERGELIQPGQDKNLRADDPGMRGQPGQATQ